MRRPLLIGIAVVAFLAISFEIAWYLTQSSRERTAVFNLLKDQARGDGPGVLRRLSACDARCQGIVAKNEQRLRRPGDVKILSLTSGPSTTIGASTGTARVAWESIGHGLPVVQCVVIRSKWSPVGSASITLLRLSAPIGNTADC